MNVTTVQSRSIVYNGPYTARIRDDVTLQGTWWARTNTPIHPHHDASKIGSVSLPEWYDLAVPICHPSQIELRGIVAGLELKLL